MEITVLRVFGLFSFPAPQYVDDNTAMGIGGIPKGIQEEIGEYPRAEIAEARTHQNMDCNAMPIGLHDNIGVLTCFQSLACYMTVSPK